MLTIAVTFGMLETQYETSGRVFGLTLFFLINPRLQMVPDWMLLLEYSVNTGLSQGTFPTIH